MPQFAPCCLTFVTYDMYIDIMANLIICFK